MYQHESTWWLLIDTLWDTLLIGTLQLWFSEAWRRVTPYDGPAWFQSDATIIIFSFSPTLDLSIFWFWQKLLGHTNVTITPPPCHVARNIKAGENRQKKVGKKCPLLTPPHPWQTPYSKSLLRPHAVTYSIRPSPRTPGCHPEFIDKISPAISFCITSSTNLMPASDLSYRRPHQARGFEIRPNMRIVKWSPEYDHFILVNMWTPPAVKYAKLFLSDSTKGVKFGHLRESSCRLGNLHFLARKLIDKSEIHFSCTC